MSRAGHGFGEQNLRGTESFAIATQDQAIRTNKTTSKQVSTRSKRMVSAECVTMVAPSGVEYRRYDNMARAVHWDLAGKTILGALAWIPQWSSYRKLPSLELLKS